MRPFIKGRHPDTAHFWALYIDVEGFSYLYEEHAMKPMSFLTSDIFALLDSGRPEFSGLSAIQYGGDGFLIKQLGSVYDKDIRRPLAIGCALMKRALVDGFTLRAQLSVGDSADVQGTYSEPMQERIKEQNAAGYLSVYRGSARTFNNMLYNSVIGTSILNAYRLQQPKGPLFVVDPLLKEDMETAGIQVTESKEALLFDWLRHDDDYVRSGMEVLEINGEFDHQSALRKYIQKYEGVIPADWRIGAESLLCMRYDSSSLGPHAQPL